VSARPDVSIVLELDNPRRTSADRAPRMLQRLAAEIEDLPIAAELIVAHDDEDVSGDDARALVDRAFPSRADVVFVPVRSVAYYA